MKCFYHQTLDAIGTCKCCAKGLCANCAADIDDWGLACREKHEAAVRKLNSLIQRNIKAQTLAGPSRRWTTLFYFLLGGIFMSVAIAPYRHHDIGFASFFVGTGIVFIGYGVVIRHLSGKLLTSKEGIGK